MRTNSDYGRAKISIVKAEMEEQFIRFYEEKEALRLNISRTPEQELRLEALMNEPRRSTYYIDKEDPAMSTAKMLYYYHDGRQIMSPAYNDSVRISEKPWYSPWCNQLIEMINISITETKVDKKKIGLRCLLDFIYNTYTNLTVPFDILDQRIHQEISKALANTGDPRYCINMHNHSASGLLGRKTETHKRLALLVS